MCYIKAACCVVVRCAVKANGVCWLLGVKVSCHIVLCQQASSVAWRDKSGCDGSAVLMMPLGR
jgi:hypothetical protein